MDTPRLKLSSCMYKRDLLLNLPPIICQSRTDGVLPIRLDHWERGAECFKSNNEQDRCLRASDCIKEDGPYCQRFRDGRRAANGQDLGTVLFYRKVTEEDPGNWKIDLPGGTTTWAIVTAITNVNEQRPIIITSGVSCDRVLVSTFPSVYGKESDVLLLSQSFDDTALESDFRPPDGTSLLGWVRSNDKVSFVCCDAPARKMKHSTDKLLSQLLQGRVPLRRKVWSYRTDREAHHWRPRRTKGIKV